MLILDRNQPVARLERVMPDEQAEDRLARLERDGLVRRSKQPVPIELLKSAPPKPKQSVLSALLEERREGW